MRIAEVREEVGEGGAEVEWLCRAVPSIFPRTMIAGRIAFFCDSSWSNNREDRNTCSLGRHIFPSRDYQWWYIILYVPTLAVCEMSVGNSINTYITYWFCFWGYIWLDNHTCFWQYKKERSIYIRIRNHRKLNFCDLFFLLIYIMTKLINQLNSYSLLKINNLFRLYRSNDNRIYIHVWFRQLSWCFIIELDFSREAANAINTQ